MVDPARSLEGFELANHPEDLQCVGGLHWHLGGHEGQRQGGAEQQEHEEHARPTSAEEGLRYFEVKFN